VCASPARQAKIADQVRTCLTCPAEFATTSPNRTYCSTCASERRRDHSRKKGRTRLGYQKSIRIFTISDLVARDGSDCWLCKEPIDLTLSGKHPRMASYDHVIPTSRGGSDEPKNLKLAHLACNIAKGAKLVTLQL
jgi:5-methylcytosine-specific restriction endonuclease McrA